MEGASQDGVMSPNVEKGVHAKGRLQVGFQNPGRMRKAPSQWHIQHWGSEPHEGKGTAPAWWGSRWPGTGRQSLERVRRVSAQWITQQQ